MANEGFSLLCYGKNFVLTMVIIDNKRTIYNSYFSMFPLEIFYTTRFLVFKNILLKIKRGRREWNTYKLEDKVTSVTVSNVMGSFFIAGFNCS